MNKIECQTIYTFSVLKSLQNLFLHVFYVKFRTYLIKKYFLKLYYSTLILLVFDFYFKKINCLTYTKVYSKQRT